MFVVSAKTAHTRFATNAILTTNAISVPIRMSTLQKQPPPHVLRGNNAAHRESLRVAESNSPHGKEVFLKRVYF